MSWKKVTFHFPHLFNTAENATYEYVGPIFDKRYYDPDLMKPKRGKDFSKKREMAF